MLRNVHVIKQTVRPMLMNLYTKGLKGKGERDPDLTTLNQEMERLHQQMLALRNKSVKLPGGIANLTIHKQCYKDQVYHTLRWRLTNGENTHVTWQVVHNMLDSVYEEHRDYIKWFKEMNKDVETLNAASKIIRYSIKVIEELVTKKQACD